MALTLTDIKERLLRFDEVTLLEILHISSEDIIDRFEDIIQERADELEEELQDETYYD